MPRRKPLVSKSVFSLYAVLVLVISLYGVYLIVEPSLPKNSNVLGIRTIARGPAENMGQNAGDKVKGPPEFIQAKIQQGQGNSETKEFKQETNQNGQKPKDVMFLRQGSASGAGSGGVVATNGGEVKRHQGAIRNFPIYINPVTGEKTISTPAGTRIVTILPQTAIQNMLTKGIISKIGGHIISSGSGGFGGSTESGAFIQSGETTLIEQDDNVEIAEEDGVPVYKIKGQKEKKLFGFIPVEIDKTVVVSAATGDVESTQVPLFDRFLDILSL